VFAGGWLVFAGEWLAWLGGCGCGLFHSIILDIFIKKTIQKLIFEK
jgi:hypothetical protein